MAAEKIKPILNHPQKNTLKEKSVQIKGTNDFGARSDFAHPVHTVSTSQSAAKTTTQRITATTKEKIKLLAYFIDGTDDKQRLAFNDTVDLLADLYVKHTLNDRQRELFKDMLKEKEA